jgi:hypothetical protein
MTDQVPETALAGEPGSWTTHIAGMAVQVGSHLRQRCSWCGEVLEDLDLSRVGVVVQHDDSMPQGSTNGSSPHQPLSLTGAWEMGVLVAVMAQASWVVDHEDGAPLPPESCFQREIAASLPSDGPEIGP